MRGREKTNNTDSLLAVYFLIAKRKACPHFVFMNEQNSKDPLHGVTLETIVTQLAQHLGWVELARLVEIRCFMFDPSVTSSLKFLRHTPWARKQVEELYVYYKQDFPPKS
jgi:uncharacterized protein (DUF2132 family)